MKDIDVIELSADTPDAHHTSWAAQKGKRDLYALVLEDKDGQPIGVAQYTFANWCETFANLCLAHAERERKRGNGS